MLKKIKLYCTVIISFISILAYAQPSQIRFKNISLEDGLSQSSVTCIEQDENDMLWFGTFDGLNKYDGYDIVNYFNSKDSNTISHNFINDLLKDEYNNIWVATSLGVCKYNKLRDNFIRVGSNTIKGKKIVSLLEYKEYILAASEYEVFRINKLDFSIKTFKIHSRNTTDKIRSIYNTDDYLLISSKKSIFVFDFEIVKLREIPYPQFYTKKTLPTTVFVNKNKSVYLGTNKYLTSVSVSPKGIFTYDILIDSINVTSISEDEYGVLWIGTMSKGLISYNLSTGQIKYFNHNKSDKYSLSVNHVTSLLYGNKGILWVGTNYGGVNKWNRLVENIHSYAYNPFYEKSLSSNLVQCFYQDSKRNIWVGTVDKGLNLWEPESDSFKHFKYNPANQNSIQSNNIRSILETKLGNFWVATEAGISKLNINKGTFENLNTSNSFLSDNVVREIYQDSKDNIWIITEGGGLDLFNEKDYSFTNFSFSEQDNQSISSNNISSILEDSKGNLWIGTFDKGLCMFNYSDSTFLRFQANPQDPTSIAFDRVYALFEDNNKNLWVGLKGGLSLFNYQNKTFINYTTKEGLPNDVIVGILEDKHNTLWISTNNGICNFSKEKGVIRNYDMSDGLQSDEFLIGSCLKLRNGDFLFGGIGGFNNFNPDDIKLNTDKPKILITSFTQMNKAANLDTVIAYKKEIFINWDENLFSFGFVAIDFALADDNKYKIKLEGLDKDWINYGTKRHITYNNIPYGDYVFKVTGSNNDGVWSDNIQTVDVHVLPPWWLTIWFKTVALLFVLVLIVLWVKRREQKLIQDKQVLEERVKKRTATIVSQKKEIEIQRDTVVEQKEQIEEIYFEISQSIDYAQRLQTSILPSQEILLEKLADVFVFFKPKDKVSGDYFWWTKINNHTIITAADCTGHGVPGAFMSMLGISLLREIVVKEKQIVPNLILNALREKVIETLKQTGASGEQKDGMDMALVSINHSNNTLGFSGANNPLYLIKNKAIENVEAYNNISLIDNEKLKVNSGKYFYEIKPDKMPISIYIKMGSFKITEIQLEKGDQVYLFSDGYADQFGGAKNKKFMYKPFKRLLLNNAKKPISVQKELLNSAFENWKGNVEQIDDVLVLGIRI